jgi:hypothetical protein
MINGVLYSTWYKPLYHVRDKFMLITHEESFFYAVLQMGYGLYLWVVMYKLFVIFWDTHTHITLIFLNQK